MENGELTEKIPIHFFFFFFFSNKSNMKTVLLYFQFMCNAQMIQKREKNLTNCNFVNFDLAFALNTK